MRPRARLTPSRTAVANERGAVLALVALMLIAFLGLAALAIDLGLLYTARGEAQRAADAAAHAGAGFLMHNPAATEAQIRAEAVRVGQENLVRGEWADIDPDQDIDIDWDEDRIRVRVHRTHERDNPVRTIFASVIGFGRVSVGASAAAEIWPADSTECVLPLAIPDRWCLNNGIPCTGGEYSDGLDGTQGWEAGHNYVSWKDAVTVGDQLYWTGYSDDNDGEPLLIKPQSPQGNLQPGWFYAFRIPGNSGANDYRNSIRSCRSGNREWGVGQTVETEQGNMVGPTNQGFTDLLNDNPDAGWTPGCEGTLAQCAYGPEDQIKALTRPIALFDPRNPPAQGMNPFMITGFAAVFVEGFNPAGDVIVRFVRFTGNNPASDKNVGGPNPMIQILRLVE